MNLICPECKNNIDLEQTPNVAPEDVLECDVCGITLMVKNIDGDTITAEVIDEGK